MENADELREFVLDNLVELYLQRSVKDNNISKLNEAITSDSQHVNEILNTLKIDDCTFIKDYMIKKQELESARISYIFEQGLMLGYRLATDPISVLLGNKNTHPF